jgi:uncharacterized protein YecE (DUF72 family)
VVEDADRVLGYHFGRDRHAGESSGAVCRHFRLVLPLLETRFLCPRRVPTVELNTTGYRLPREELFERWAEQAPPGFLFAPKLNAHRRSDYGTFAERVGLLGERLGPIRVLVAAARDEGLLTLVLGSFDPSLSLALDLRHESWDGIESDLPPNAVRVNVLEANAPFRYLRLREPPYSDDELRVWADRLRPLLDEGVRVYCYFKHEDQPTAPSYALALREALGT